MSLSNASPHTKNATGDLTLPALTPNGTGRRSTLEGNHTAAVSRLMSLYGGRATGFGSDFATEGVDQSNLQYGEITYSGMEALYPALNLAPGDTFYDLGSGVGKLVLYVALRGEVARAVGLEVGERRHALAEAAAAHLSAELTEAPTKCGSFEMLRADISRHRYHDACVVVLTNLCMDMGVQNRTIDCLLKCPMLRRVVCITPLHVNARLKLARTVRVACTWAKASSWQVYEVLPAEASGSRRPAVIAVQRSRSRLPLKPSSSEPVLSQAPAEPAEEKPPRRESKVKDRLYKLVRSTRKPGEQ